jgi:hypothetical protein
MTFVFCNKYTDKAQRILHSTTEPDDKLSVLVHFETFYVGPNLPHRETVVLRSSTESTMS